jgi:hypothetical protein
LTYSSSLNWLEAFVETLQNIIAGTTLSCTHKERFVLPITLRAFVCACLQAVIAAYMCTEVKVRLLKEIRAALLDLSPHLAQLYLYKKALSGIHELFISTMSRCATRKD